LADVIDDDVVHDHYAFTGDVPGHIARTDEDPTCTVAIYKIVGDDHIAGRMPQMNTPRLVSIGDIVIDMSAAVGVVDAVDRKAPGVYIPDIVDDVSDGVRIVR
jgi:hypothetical protein